MGTSIYTGTEVYWQWWGPMGRGSSGWGRFRVVDIRAVFVVGTAGRPARPRTLHDCHHDTKVKPEAATTVIVLLMMGGNTPETC
jgi:hypothetical protein